MTSAADPTAAFLAALQASRLLAPDQLADLTAWATQTRADLPAIAKEVNRRGWLTLFQIKEIARGRGRDLTLGQFVLIDLLGEGGMGRVYKAHNTRLGRDEAVKVIRADKLRHPATQARFALEMQALGRVKHPNVVTAFDAGPIGDVHFVSMELIDGTDLTRMVKDRGPLPVPEACEYIRQSALGLHHAHELGMVHRDIKPSNILVSRDGRHVKLVDLGLARVQEALPDGATRVTQDGYVVGTPDFLAPEQARNPGGVDIRADIYALGATLFYILTGQVPFDGASPTEKLLKHCTDPPPALLPLRPDAPPPIEQIIYWCMAKALEARPQTPLQLAHALQPFCPRPISGAAPHPDPRAAAAAPPPPQLPLPAPAPAPDRSSQLFRLPAQANDQDPIRSRGQNRARVGWVSLGSGALLLLAVVGAGAYWLLRPRELPPVETFTNSVGMKMMKIDGGSFKMGSPPNEPGRPEPRPGFPDDEAPVHEVAIHGPFLMAATEVTHGQYHKVTGERPEGSEVSRRAANPAEHPVEFVSYDDAAEFCRLLTDKERGQPHARPGWAYRLPTEAEWEYCCRAGTTTPFSTGEILLNLKQARYTPTGDEKEIMLEGGSTRGSGVDHIPGKVGHFDPNSWGLYDMHGNVAEWCHDWYRRGYPADGTHENPTGPPTGERRVVRGGSFKDPASACRSAARVGVSPHERRGTIGFRVVYAPAIK